MATNYVMPKLAMGMNEGIVVEWLVSEGQQVERGAPLMQVETEKVAYDVEAPVAGWFHILVPAGETVPVESVIGQFAASAEEYAEIAGAAAPRGTTASTPAMVFDDKLTSTGAVMGTVPAAAATASATAPVTTTTSSQKGCSATTWGGCSWVGRPTWSSSTHRHTSIWPTARAWT